MLDRHEASEMSLKEFAYYFRKNHYQLKDVLQEIRPVAERMKNDIDSLSDEISFEKHSPADLRLDNMSIMEYTDSLGIKGWFRDFINSSYTARVWNGCRSAIGR